MNVTCQCERGPREIITHQDDAGVQWWTLADSCAQCFEDTSLAAARETARQEAFEEAASLCDSYADAYCRGESEEAVRDCASALRARHDGTVS